jgi:plasmid stabilization system protein ParE
MYKIFWSDNALRELQQTVHYLRQNGSEKEINSLKNAIEQVEAMIENNPRVFKIMDKSETIHCTLVAKYNTLYYRINQDRIEVLSFFSNRQNPDKMFINEK